MTQKSSLNQQEIDNFSKDSALWWDVDGPFAPLHKLNPTRMAYIKGQIQTHFTDKPLSGALKTPLKGLKALDIGCGGCLVSESLARMGAKTTGLDADPNAITTAKVHAKESGLNIDYHNITSEAFLAQHGKSFDVVCALEIIEHVDNPDFFVETALKLLKPDGILILSTLNRTIKSAVFGIFAAEYVFNLVPKGTHSHEKFIKPSELARMLRSCGAQHTDVSGLIYELKTDSFKLSSTDLSVNYFMCAVK
jgi:2-polyprenyl-6-hydroxyphenyl methylase/3-demethylubiquinone-9 3-methyltransferase